MANITILLKCFCRLRSGTNENRYKMLKEKISAIETKKHFLNTAQHNVDESGLFCQVVFTHKYFYQDFLNRISSVFHRY